jgi:two-component system OmpR family sensor kinase
MALLILFFSAFIYYNLQKEVMLGEQNSKLKEYSDKLISKLIYIHENFYDGILYPRSRYYRSAIYDGSQKEIFSTLEEKTVDFNKHIYVIGDKIHYVRLLERYYLGAMYLVIEIDDNNGWFNFFKKKVLFYGVMLFIFLIFVGYFLLKILLKPMRESIYLLDRFIKDTTHELNTPVNAIMINIETFSKEKLDEKNLKKLNRIDIAARTITNIYNDLTYMSLKNRIISKDEDINLSKLIKERTEFFKIIASQKKVTYQFDLDESVTLKIDKNKITRVLDNLISNAIKYNKKGGFIKLRLKSNYFEIEDSGIGMSEDEIKNIFKRYSRFHKSIGGFGIGLNIVWEIIKEYDMKITVKSKPKEGTIIRVEF